MTEMAEIETIDCPWAKSEWSPCIARDGGRALADDGVCVGCGKPPGDREGDVDG
mgnify:CR=1 FL=1